MFCPSLIVTTAEAWHGGHMGKAEHVVSNHFFIHGITPETPTSTHYFAGLSFGILTDDENYIALWEKINDGILWEDIHALESIEARIPLEKDLSHEISARADNGALRARRLISDLIRAEVEAD